MKKLLFILLAVILGFSILNGQARINKKINPIRKNNSIKNERNATAWIYSLKKDVLNLYVRNDGYFSLERKDGSLLLFYGSDPELTSHTNFKIGNSSFNNYDFSEYRGTLSGNVQVVPKTKIVIDYGLLSQNVQVKQEFIPVEDVAKKTGSLYIKTIFINKSPTAKNVGALLHLDIQINSNDNASIFMNGKLLELAQIINPIPDIWLAYEDYGNQNALIGRGQLRGNINGMLITPPNWVYVGDWNKITAYGYDYDDYYETYNPYDLGDYYGDSEILLRWNQVSIQPNDSVFFSTLYGVTESEYTSTDYMTVDCNIPADSISIDNSNNYTPNPFDFTVNIKKSTSSQELTNVKAKIEFDPNVFQLNPVSESSTKSVSPSTLYNGDLGSCKWSFTIKNQASAKTSQIKVIVSADQIPSSDISNSCSKTIYIPASASSCSLTTNVNGSGTIAGNTGTQSYPCGTQVSLRATANSCYTFSSWTGDIGSGNPTIPDITVTVNGNLNVTANFSKIKYPLTTNIVGGGTISGNTGSPYNCDTIVNLTTTQAACYRFTEWTGDIPFNLRSFQTINIQMDKAKNVTANFEKIKYTLTASSYTNGSILVNGSPYANSLQFNCGDTVKLKAIPNACYGFDKWWDDSKTDSTTIVIKSDTTIFAGFNLSQPVLTVKVNPDGSGKVKDGADVDFRSPSSYPCKTPIMLKAVSNQCFKFINWTNENGIPFDTAASTNFELLISRTLTANFQKIKYNLTVNDPADSGLITYEGSKILTSDFDCGTKVTLNAAPNKCYRFVGWYSNNIFLDSLSTYSFDMNKDTNIYGKFIKSRPILTVKINLPNSGEIWGSAGSTPYDCGIIKTLQAYPYSCHRFSNWTDDKGIILSTDSIYSFEMDKDRTVIANFIRNNYSVTVTIDPPGSGSVTGEGTYLCGTKVTLTAKANGCNEFLGWVGDTAASSASITIDMYKEKSVTAKFGLIKYELKTDVNGSGKITGNTSLKYNCGDLVSLKAAADPCNKFTGWSGDTITTQPEINVSMYKTKNIIANFEKIKYALLTSVSPSGSGTITGNTGAQQYDCDQVVSLEAKADPCYTFLYWSDDTTNSNAIRTVKMDIDRSIQAIFKIKQYSLTTSIDINGSGIISKEPEKTLYNCGEKVRLTLSSEPCYSFVCWNNNPGLSLSSLEVIIDDNKSYIAQMAKIDLNYYGVNTSNLPNIVLNFRVDSITKNQSYPMSSLQKNLLVISDSGCGNAIIGNYNLITKNDPYKIVYDFDNKCFSKPCDTSRYATIIFRRNDCEIRKTLTYSVPLNLGCDSCGRIVIRTDTIPKQTINMLFNNMPNPFNPETRIRYNISEAGMVTMAVYDLLGREISILVNEFQDVGEYEVSFIPRNLPGGVYFYIIKTKNYTSVKKMVYVK